jgi:ribosomal protein L37AE/L43A
MIKKEICPECESDNMEKVNEVFVCRECGYSGKPMEEKPVEDDDEDDFEEFEDIDEEKPKKAKKKTKAKVVKKKRGKK